MEWIGVLRGEVSKEWIGVLREKVSNRVDWGVERRG